MGKSKNKVTQNTKGNPDGSANNNANTQPVQSFVYDENMREIVLGEKSVKPIDDSPILQSRLGYKQTAVKKYANCVRLTDLKTGKEIGIIPNIQLGAVWAKAGKYGGVHSLSKTDWTDNSQKITKFLKGKNDNDLLVQDVYGISSLNYIKLFLVKGVDTVEVIRSAILEDIRESNLLLSKWNKIKKYSYKVPLEAVGWIFSRSDADTLRAHGVRYLNDIRKLSVYDLKNMFLRCNYATLIEDINAAFKEDWERRKDKIFQVVPFIFGFAAMIAVGVPSYIFGYTLLKNRDMTALIIGFLALWLFNVGLVIFGALRAIRRRRTKRPDYRYFTRGVKGTVIAFAMISIFSITSATVFYERYDGYDDKFFYRRVPDGNIAVAGLFDKRLAEINIPTQIDGKDVVKISGGAFAGGKLTGVTVPYGIKEIGGSAFADNDSLTRVNLPAGVTVIGNKAFNDCDRLINVTMGEGVEIIGSRAFGDCRSLEIITLPQSVTFIGANAFVYCGALTEIEFGDNIESIGSGAFKKCVMLKEITLPESVEVIGEETFKDCASLAYIEMRGGIKQLGARAFAGCESCKRINAEDTKNLTVIASGLFKDCTALENTNLFENANKIEDGALSGCTSLKSFEIPKTAEYLGKEIFYGCSALKELSVPFIGKNVSDLKKVNYLVNDKVPLENIEITAAEKIARKAFAKSNIKEAVIGSGTAEIGDGAFSDCIALTDVTLPSDLTAISADTFKGCYVLNSLTGCGNVESIGDSAFEGCGRLASVNLPKAVTIGASSFEGCYSLVTVSGLTQVERIGKEAFKNCTDLRNISLPATFEVIEDYTFSGCDKLDVFVFPVGLKKIGEHAFSQCNALVNVNLSGLTSLETLGKYAFSSCSSLTGLTLPDCITEITEGLLYGNFSLRNYTVGSNIRVIGKFAFANSEITDITIPSSVTEICESAFSRCGNLRAVTVPSSVEKMGKNAFAECGNLTSFTAPYLGKSPSSTGGGYKHLFGKGYVTDITITDGEVIKKGMFGGGEKIITSVRLSSGVKELKGGLFKGFTQITAFTVPSAVEKTGDELFSGCTSLKTVVLPDSLTAIGKRTFYGCDSLNAVEIPKGVKVIGKEAFRLCTSLKSVNIPSNVERIESDAFRGCASVTVVNFETGLKYIGNNAFRESSVKQAILPEGLETVMSGAFKNCKSLESAYIPSTVKKIENNNYTGGAVFGGCDSLENLAVPFIGSKADSAKKITYLTDSRNLTTVAVTGAEKIAKEAFKGSSVKNIVLYAGIKSIGDGAFDGCNLKQVMLHNSLTEFEGLFPEGTVSYFDGDILN